jgi:hypothetical protein
MPPPTPAPTLVDIALPPAAEELDELLCVTSWLTRDAHRLRLTYAERGLGERIARLPAFAAGPTRSRHPRR